MKLSKLILAISLMLTIWSCKAQSLPSYAVVGGLSAEPTAEEYISWYNATVKNPIYDTVTVFKVPDFSDLRYIIITTTGVGRIEYNNGRFIGWLQPDRQWVETVKFDAKGRVVAGMNPIMISAVTGKLRIQYERCPECKYIKTKGDL